MQYFWGPKHVNISNIHAPKDDRVKVYETFLSQLLVVDQFAMPQIVEDGTKVGGVSVDHVGPRLILLQTEENTLCYNFITS